MANKKNGFSFGKKVGSFIDNQFLNEGQSEIKHFCKITNKLLCTLLFCSEKQMKESVITSRETFLLYKKFSIKKRVTLLLKLHKIILSHKNIIANFMVSEMGKTITEAKAEVDYAASYFSYYAKNMHLQKKALTINNSQKKLWANFEPIGVCGFITPWNFPFAAPCRKIAAALAAGCTCILKPSPETPLTSLYLAKLIKEAGFLPGTCQVLIGEEKKIGKTLLSSPLIQKFSFTGSTNVGKYLYKESANTLKRLSLELGGLAPFIIFEDADLDKAANEAIFAKFRNSGQTCVAASFFLVHEKVYDAFTKIFESKVKKLKIKNPFLASAQFSTYLHIESLNKAKRHLKDALKKGAKALLKTDNPAHPQILTGCTKNMLICKEETFSPIAPLISFKTDEEAISLANNTPYGLASYLFTENQTRANRMIKELDFGMVGYNDGLFSSCYMPFGGVKESGFGTEGGPHALDDFLVCKSVSQKIS